MSQRRPRRDREHPFLSADRSLDAGKIQEKVRPVVDEWQYGLALIDVRRRLKGLFGTGLLVVAIQVLLDPGGLTGTLITLWFLLSLPVVALTACLLALLRDPLTAADVWWKDGVLATVGLISLAVVVHLSRLSPYGRVVWELLFGGSHPDDDRYEFGSGESRVDLSVVSRIRRYVWFAVVGSAAIILIEQVIRTDSLGAGIFEGLLGTDPGPLSWTLLALALGATGAIIGAGVAAMDL